MEINEKQRKFIKIALYIGGLILIVIVLRLSKYTTEKNDKKILENNEKIFETIKNINESYYSSKIQLVLDDDAISLDYERVLDLEMGVKKYHGETTEYIKKDDEYYFFDEGNFGKIDNFVDFNYDRTFMDLKIIKRLLDINVKAKTYKNDDYLVIKLEYSLEDTLPLYNEFNNTEIVKIDDANVILELYCIDDNVQFLLVDVTEFYNLINDMELKNVIYKIQFESNKEQDISWLLEKLV